MCTTQSEQNISRIDSHPIGVNAERVTANEERELEADAAADRTNADEPERKTQLEQVKDGTRKKVGKQRAAAEDWRPPQP